MSSENYKFVLYSHDAMGIGHVRRNLRIAQALTTVDFGGRGAEVLLISGVAEAAAFVLPPHVDFLTLPSLRKLDNGRYTSRRLSIGDSSMIQLRSRTIQAAVEAFAPDAVIVDKLPRGVANELGPTIDDLQARRYNGTCRMVLGLRDVLDEPAVVRREWAQEAVQRTIEDCYDAVWIYGDPAVYDTIGEYGFSPRVAAKAQYTGYLAAPASCLTDTTAEAGDVILCLVGGGEDGASLAKAFARTHFPSGTLGVLVTGPFMPSDAKRHLADAAAENSQLRVYDFTPDCARLLARARRVISMGGYNTVCESLAAGKPSLIVPRVTPRSEQWIRAHRLAELGLLSVVHPGQLSPAALEEWIRCPNPPAPSASNQLDFGGHTRLARLMSELLGVATIDREVMSRGRLAHAVS